MLLSPPHDIPAATLLVGTTSTLPPVEDAISPVVIARCVTPGNRALRYLEAGTLGASEPHHVPSRPSVPDLCIASSSLLSVIDPLPLDRVSRHSVTAIRYWPSTDRRHILAVASWDIRVARQNLPNFNSTLTTMQLMSPTVLGLTTTRSRSCQLRPSPVWRAASGRHWRRWTVDELYIFHDRTLMVINCMCVCPVIQLPPPMESVRHFLEPGTYIN